MHDGDVVQILLEDGRVRRRSVFRVDHHTEFDLHDEGRVDNLVEVLAVLGLR